jgi:xylulokinase
MKGLSSPLLLGIDVGTSAVKVGLFATDGRTVSLAWRAYATHTPHPGWAEQMPDDWWTAACSAIREALAETEAEQVAAVGLCGQTPGHALVDASGRAVGPAIIWQDRRAEAEAAWLGESVTAQQAQDWVGLDGLADSALPPARLLWLQKHRPDEWARCAAVLQPKDYISLRLTGEFATDPYSAFGLANADTEAYSPALFALLGVEMRLMPPLRSPTAVAGGVTQAASEQTGLPAGTPVVVGTVDAWAEIIGCGGAAPGRAVDIAGTSEVVALVADCPPEVQDITGSRLIGNLRWLGGPTQAGGGALRWFAEGFYPGTDSAESGRLEADAASVQPGSDGLIFLPYLAGERAPIWDSAARGAFVGLTFRHTRAHCARAVYEGVAFAVRHILALAEQSSGLTADAVRVSGGGSRSALWNQIKADVTGKRVLEMEASEAGALGAAMLAAIGTGIHRDHEAATAAMVRAHVAAEPNPDHRLLYELSFARYQSLYAALKGWFSEPASTRGERERA